MMVNECIFTMIATPANLATVFGFAQGPLRAQRPFSIIKRHIPFNAEESPPPPPKAMVEAAAAAEGESVCQFNVRIGL